MNPWSVSPRLLAMLALFAAGGCATLQDPLRANLAAQPDEVRECAAWYRDLDARIDRAGVRDGGEYRLPGFPYLRTDRFVASFRTAVASSPEKFAAWVVRMRDLDRTARGYEIANLPDQALQGDDRAHLMERSRACADVLMARDLDSSEHRELLMERAQVPDDYVTWHRAVGLYAITKVPFASGVEDWHEEATAAFRDSAAGALPFAVATRFLPAALPAAGTAAMVAKSRRDALGVPELSPEQEQVLFDAHAPVIEVETTGDFDRIGALSWAADSVPSVDSARPTVYRKLAYMRYGEDTLLQLVYVAWFSERPLNNSFDMLGGRLDGIVWRVTLDPRGEPVVYDTIHPCGCFHMFMPAEGVDAVPAPSKWIEWAFAPAGAPKAATGERLRLRLQTRTHYMVGLAADATVDGERYALGDYDGLRSLPLAGGGARSAFRPDGLISGTERGERNFFWPMGVPSAGAMRQWGRHSTAFLGRRHFDDADLIERRFVFH